MKKIFLIILLGSLLFPLISSAGTYTADGSTVSYRGLVPCGTKVCINGEYEKIDGETVCTGTEDEIRCQFCHFFVMLNELINFILKQLVFPIAVLMLVIGGVMFIFAYFGGAEVLPGGGAGGPKMLNQAKKLISSVVIGLIIIFSAWLIIGLFLQLIGLADWTTNIFQSWWTQNIFQINCPISLD